jgi:hypothetical protein
MNLFDNLEAITIVTPAPVAASPTAIKRRVIAVIRRISIIHVVLGVLHMFFSSYWVSRIPDFRLAVKNQRT